MLSLLILNTFLATITTIFAVVSITMAVRSRRHLKRVKLAAAQRNDIFTYWRMKQSYRRALLTVMKRESGPHYREWKRAMQMAAKAAEVDFDDHVEALKQGGDEWKKLYPREVFDEDYDNRPLKVVN